MAEAHTYEVVFHYKDDRGFLQRGSHVVSATSVNNAIAATKAEMSWKCKNMSSFSTRKLD